MKIDWVGVWQNLFEVMVIFLVALIIGVYIFQNMLNCTLKIFACFICKFYSQKNTYLGGYVLMFLFALEICFKCIRKK